MKRITSILLTLSFVLYLGGVQVMYWIKMSIHKQEAQVLIQDNKESGSDIVDFTFSSSEYAALSWSEQNKEFAYNGQRYDIMEIRYCVDKIIVSCYSDKEETNLVESFSGFIKKMFSSPQHNDTGSNDIVNNICKEYLPAEPLIPSFYDQVLISIGAKCVLVDVCPKIGDIWHPPTLV